jgi:hypothetical protein
VRPSSYLFHVIGHEVEESKAGLHERLLAEVEANGFDEEKINQSLSPDYKPEELRKGIAAVSNLCNTSRRGWAQAHSCPRTVLKID